MVLPVTLQTHADSLPGSEPGSEQAPALIVSLTTDLLGSWHMPGAILDASPDFRELAVWERQTISRKPYHMCYRGGHWGALRNLNDLDLAGVIRSLLEEPWASYLTFLNLCFLICNITFVSI